MFRQRMKASQARRAESAVALVVDPRPGLNIPGAVTSSKPTGRRASRRASASKPSTQSQPARASAGMANFTEEWWKSWRQANALAWDYLNAVSGLMRLNMSAFTRVPPIPTLFQTP
jgi:hypothetical protein